MILLSDYLNYYLLLFFSVLKYGSSILPHLAANNGTSEVKSVQLHSRVLNSRGGPINHNSYDRTDNYGLTRTTRFDHLPNI